MYVSDWWLFSSRHKFTFKKAANQTLLSILFPHHFKTVTRPADIEFGQKLVVTCLYSFYRKSSRVCYFLFCSWQPFYEFLLTESSSLSIVQQIAYCQKNTLLRSCYSVDGDSYVDGDSGLKYLLHQLIDFIVCVILGGDDCKLKVWDARMSVDQPTSTLKQ